MCILLLMMILRHDEAQRRLGELRNALAGAAAESKRRIAKAESEKVQCDVCSVWTDADDIVWRGPELTCAVCDECEPEGDDCR